MSTIDRPVRKIATVIIRRSLHDPDDELAYWLSRPVEERIAAVEVLRRRVFGISDDTATGSRLQRVCRVVRRA
ncbi:MAG: hypothetical protein QM733_08835 [Ilumatobacteraceae bacterium]